LSSPAFYCQSQAAWCHASYTTWARFCAANIKYDFNKRRFIARSLFIMSEFYVFVLCVRVCILCTVFFIDNVVRLLLLV